MLDTDLGLEKLSADIDSLASSRDGGYFWRVRQELHEQSFEDISDAEVRAIARELVMKDMGIWVAATAQEDTAEAQQD